MVVKMERAGARRISLALELHSRVRRSDYASPKACEEQPAVDDSQTTAGACNSDFDFLAPKK